MINIMTDEDLTYFHKRFMDEMDISDVVPNESTCYSAALAFLARCAKLKCLGRLEDLKCLMGVQVAGFKAVSLYGIAVRIIELNDEYWEYDFVNSVLRNRGNWRVMNEEKLGKCEDYRHYGMVIETLSTVSSIVLAQTLRICTIRTVLKLFPYRVGREQWDELIVQMTHPESEFVKSLVHLCDDLVLFSDGMEEFRELDEYEYVNDGPGAGGDIDEERYGDENRQLVEMKEKEKEKEKEKNEGGIMWETMGYVYGQCVSWIPI